MAAYIEIDPASGSDTTKWTYSVWFKRASLNGLPQSLVSSTGGSSVSYTEITLQANNSLIFYNSDSGNAGKLETNAKYEDLGAWYHVVCVWDPGNGTATDKMKMYVNGVEPSFLNDDAPGANSTIGNTYPHFIGAYDSNADRTANTQYFLGDMSHSQMYNNAVYAVTDFGSFDATSGIWKIKTSGPSATYGTNGWFLKMEDRTNLDLDSSNNAYTFTTTGTLTATYDNPSNNFSTMNPLDNYFFDATFSNGNNTVVTTSPSNETYGTSTLGLQAGLWYFEVKCASDTSNANQNIGITNQPSQASDDYYLGRAAGEYSYAAANGQWYTAASGTAYGDTYAPTDIIGVYVDLTASKLYFAKNGTVQNSGTGIDITAVGSSTQGVYFPAASYQESGASATFDFNFGNGYFGTTAVTSAVADEGGIGAFEYDPSAGTFDSASKDFRAICTKNIKAYGG